MVINRVKVLGRRLHTSTQIKREYPPPPLSVIQYPILRFLCRHPQLRFENTSSLSLFLEFIYGTCKGRLITFRIKTIVVVTHLELCNKSKHKNPLSHIPVHDHAPIKVYTHCASRKVKGNNGRIQNSIILAHVKFVHSCSETLAALQLRRVVIADFFMHK